MLRHTTPAIKMTDESTWGDSSAQRRVHLAEEKMVFETSDNVKVVHSFEEFGLKEDLLRGVYASST